MKSWNYDAPKMVLDVRVDYSTVLIAPDGHEMFGRNQLRPYELREIRETMAEALTPKGYRLKVERHVSTWWVPACWYCQARPCAIDFDCDGPYRRVVCEQEQCQRGSNPDNRDWVTGRGPLWGPEHPEWGPATDPEGVELCGGWCVLTAGHDADGTNRHVDATGYAFSR
jgi:hypothetical protein